MYPVFVVIIKAIGFFDIYRIKVDEILDILSAINVLL
jgi:hypothetical protein